MGHIQGENRYQIKLMSLDGLVDPESTARIIDRFIDIADLDGFGFKNTIPNERGRDSYSPSCMTKLYVYGYEGGIKSSRKLENLTHTNTEAMWLTGGLKPDFKTIADFRKDNGEALKKLFYEFTAFCESGGLIGKKLSAIDGTKIRAGNNKKNNYSRKKIEERIEYNRKRAEEYLAAIDKSDDAEESARLAGKEAFRTLHRGPHGDIYDRTDKVFNENIELYKQRQQIVEHVFGTVKRTMNGGYFLLRTMQKVETEVALLFLGYYNIKRAKSALGFADMMAALDRYAATIGTNAFFFFVKFLNIRIANPIRGIFRDIPKGFPVNSALVA